MKKFIIYTLAVILLVSCKKGDINTVKFYGTITNKNSNEITIFNKDKNYKKVIHVNDQGKFQDTLKVSEGFYGLSDGKEYTQIYLRNGLDLNMTIDSKKFDETINFTGIGAEENNLVVSIMLKNEEIMETSPENMTDQEFDGALKKATDEINTKLKSIETATELFKSTIEVITKQYTQAYAKIRDQKIALKALAKGKDAPSFSGYENIKGDKVSLKDLKGKYVLIDVWATWCPPCKAEIPYFKKLSEEFKGKNIEFVGISIDKEQLKSKWQAMVNEKRMPGRQLFSGNDINFIQAYAITSIPRFILIDPNGKIVNPDAPRPSSDELKKMLTSLNI